MNRRGLSLLEVILATAILLAATVTMGRLAFITTQHAQRAEDRAVAMEIAEFQLQQLLLGQLPVQAMARGPVLPESAGLESERSATHPWDDWQFALQVASTDLPTVERVQIDVFRVRPGGDTAGLGATPAGSESSGGVSSSMGGAALRADDVLFQYSVVRLVHVSR